MNSKLNRKSLGRSAFTLIELLVTISLMATVAAMFLVAYRGAATEASNVRTSSTIRKISEVLMSRLQEYEYTPVSFLNPISGNANATLFGESPTILRDRARLLALREMMCIEMPDHPDDIKWTTAWSAIPFPVDANGYPSTKIRPSGLGINVGTTTVPNIVNIPPLQIRITSRATRIVQRLSIPGSFPLVPIPNWEARNANAELLFLIVEDSLINGSSAIEVFGKSEIGDTDGDGLNEFLDAFRRPIQWIRWPSGFPGSLRYHPDLMDPMLLDTATGNNRFVGDSFDRMKSDPGFRETNDPNLIALRPGLSTFPLVASPGADGIFGLTFELDPSSIPSSPTSYSIFTGSKSTGDIRFPTSYDASLGPVFIADPWFPRTNPDLRLGSILNPVANQDDITNYDNNGASL